MSECTAVRNADLGLVGTMATDEWAKPMAMGTQKGRKNWCGVWLPRH